MIRHISLSLLVCLLLVGCGYHLGEVRPTVMRATRSMAIPTFKNNTLEFRIETLVTDTTIKAFQMDGTYRIVGGEIADTILECTITRAERRSVRSVLDDVLATKEFELDLEISYIARDRVTGVILQEGKVVGRTSFFSSPDLQTDERQAVPIAAERAAQELVGRLTEGW